jgi:hypothetical protein
LEKGSPKSGGTVKLSTIANAKASLDFIDKISQFLEKMKNYKPEVKSLRVNYVDRTTEMKLLLSIPQGIGRSLRHIEIPAYPGYVINEVFDGNTLNRLELNWVQKGPNWEANAKELLAGDKYFVILKGAISKESLDALVKLYCPEDPKRTPELDLYWIDSAIKDMAILEKIYDELTVDRVATCVNVGLERQFSSSIPREIKNWFRARAEADMYLASKDRQAAFKSFYSLRLAQKKVGRISASDVYKLGTKLLSPETFMYYVLVDRPFRISGLVQSQTGGLYPEKIGVSVETDLNYKVPVAQGDLIFKKIEFTSKLEDEVKQLPGLPKRLISKKKKHR